MEDLKEFADFRNEDSLNEISINIKLPIGYFEVLKDFKLSPGGGWSMSFKKGSLVNWDDAGLHSWIPISKTWKDRVPPISGETKFHISRFSGSDGMLKTFYDNTKSVSKSIANKIMDQQPPEKVFPNVKSAIRFLGTIPRNSKVKISL